MCSVHFTQPRWCSWHQQIILMEYASQQGVLHSVHRALCNILAIGATSPRVLLLLRLWQRVRDWAYINLQKLFLSLCVCDAFLMWFIAGPPCLQITSLAKLGQTHDEQPHERQCTVCNKICKAYKQQRKWPCRAYGSQFLDTGLGHAIYAATRWQGTFKYIW